MKKSYIATLIDDKGEECGTVVVEATSEQAARGLLMSIGINDYCDLTEVG